MRMPPWKRTRLRNRWKLVWTAALSLSWLCAPVCAAALSTLVRSAPNPAQGEGRFLLTFDDGPSKLLGGLLDELGKRNMTAGFFFVGVNLVDESQRALVRRALKDGHLIGCHVSSSCARSRASMMCSPCRPGLTSSTA